MNYNHIKLVLCSCVCFISDPVAGEQQHVFWESAMFPEWIPAPKNLCGCWGKRSWWNTIFLNILVSVDLWGVSKRTEPQGPQTKTVRVTWSRFNCWYAFEGQLSAYLALCLKPLPQVCRETEIVRMFSENLTPGWCVVTYLCRNLCGPRARFLKSEASQSFLISPQLIDRLQASCILW